MINTEHNPPVTALLRWLTAIETSVVLVSGFGLFFLPQIFRPLWPWEIAPFNTRFMAAIYLTSFFAATILAWKARWSPARVVLPMIFTFTSIILFVSIGYYGRFTLPLSTLFWFALYIIIPINALYHLWLYRDLPPADSVPTPTWLRAIIIVEVIIFGGYGLGLLIASTFFSGFWPWGIDDFHARMYCVAFITPAVGAWYLRNQGSALEYLTLGIAQVAGGILPIIGLIIVDLSVKRVDWANAGTWLWIGLGVFSAAIGITMLFHARQIRE